MIYPMTPDRARRIEELATMPAEDVARREWDACNEIAYQMRAAGEPSGAIEVAVLAGLEMFVDDIRAGERLRMRSAS